jgi:hypothetical protein
MWKDVSIVIRTFLQMFRDALKRAAHPAPASADERGVVQQLPTRLQDDEAECEEGLA